MKLIHAAGFDDSERESFRVIVYANIMLAMQILIEAMDQLHIPLEHESNKVGILVRTCLKHDKLIKLFN